MHTHHAAFFAALACLIAKPVKLHASTAPVKIRADKHTEMSILVTRVHDGRPLFAHQPDLHLIPASTSKLPTALCSLELFGTYSNFKTPVLIHGQRFQSTIRGDLVIQGVGDPLLINEKLWQTAADLQHMGIKQITGDLIIDNSLFTDDARDSSREFGEYRSSNAYDAPVTALAFNFNTIPIAIYPNPQQKGKALVHLDPYPLPSIQIINQIQTSPKGSRRVRVARQTDQGQSRVLLNGNLDADAPLQKVYRSAGKPTVLAGEQIRAFLTHVGISIKGKIRSEKTPATAKIIYEIDGFPIAKMIQGLNKFSNNFIADMLVKKLGASFGQSGSLADGLEVIKNCLNKRLPSDPKRKLFTGSGLDPRNQQSAEDLVNLLLFAEHKIDIFPEFIASLPVAGIDGTLEDRFRARDTALLRGKLRAKTGTLTSPVTVSGLAGYFNHPKHGLVAFAMLANGKLNRPQPNILDLRQYQEQLLLDLWQQL